MALIKPPDGGSEKPWHQDKAYFDVALDAPVVGVWIALDEATAENGCMHVVPGSHRGGPVVHFDRRDWQICDTDVQVDEDVMVPLAPGGALLFDGLVHHGTPPNRSEARRRALQFHYTAADAEWVEGGQDAFGSEGTDSSADGSGPPASRSSGPPCAAAPAAPYSPSLASGTGDGPPPEFKSERAAIPGRRVTMVEAFAVASGKGGTGKTTSTLALGMALAEGGEYDVTVVDADTGMANLLFHAGLSEADPTLHDVLAGEAAVEAATYERFGMRVVPCGTSLEGFRDADPVRLRDAVADLAGATDVLLLDSAAALGSKSAVLPVVLADRVVVVLQPTVPSLSDALKVGEYAASYGTGTAGLVFNRVRDDERIDAVASKAERYFDGPTLAAVPEDDAARAARRAGEPLLAHAPDAPASRAFRDAADALAVRPVDEDAVADRFRRAVIPETP